MAKAPNPAPNRDTSGLIDPEYRKPAVSPGPPPFRPTGSGPIGQVGAKPSGSVRGGYCPESDVFGSRESWAPFWVILGLIVALTLAVILR